VAEQLTADMPELTDAEREILAGMCGCAGCNAFRSALEDLFIKASMDGMSPPCLVRNVAAAAGTTLGQLAEDDGAAALIADVCATMTPFAEMANRAAQAVALRYATEGATCQ
jgi:hypothetical protein